MNETQILTVCLLLFFSEFCRDLMDLMIFTWIFEGVADREGVDDYSVELMSFF